jgi:hypothetical protein
MGKNNRKVKCKNLVVITGMSCQGKTFVSVKLREECGFYIIHTDLLYHPLDREPIECNVGEESEDKNRFIREQIPLLTETTIIEGSHIGNSKELDIFIRELDFDGEVYVFRVNSPDHELYFKNKHKEQSRENWGSIKKWWDSIYDLRSAIIVEGYEDIINFLEIKNGSICLSR